MSEGLRPRFFVVLTALALVACGPAGGASTPGPGSAGPSTAATSALPGRIAFGRFDNAVGDFQVFTMLADGSDVRQLKAQDATLALGCAAWSPDGKRLACEGWDDASPDRVGMYTVRSSDGGGLTRITSSADHGHDIPGDYAPDGTRIAFVHVTDDPNEKGQLWIVNADGSGSHRASELTIGFGVAWSPDGRWIVGDGDGSLLIFDAADLSSAPRRITLPAAFAFGASWSRDGSRLVFSLVPGGKNSADIATIAADGTDLWVLTSDPAKEEFADWGTSQ